MRSRPYGASWVPGPAVWLGALVVILVGAAAGWGLATHLTAQPTAAPAEPPVDVPVGNARVTLRAGWSPVDRGPALAGLDRPGTRAFQPSDGGGGRLVLAPLDGQGTALPAATLAALRVPAGSSRRVTVGGVAGASYAGLAVRGVDGLADVYVVPTAAGPIAVACVAPIADPLPAGACPEDVVAVSAIRRAADPAAALLASAPKLLTTLDRRRVAGRRALRRAHTPAAQARGARALARAYAQTAAATKALAPATGPTAALPAVLSGADDAYGRLALAAAHRDRPAWRRARVAVAAAERAVAAQLDVVRGAA
jgi:hypothetical protein